MTKISVCLAVYNGSDYIEDQLRSILNELDPTAEVLISDDGSTDKSLEIINSFDDKRIRLLDGPKRGVVENFEFLMAQATGEILFLADQDDVWPKGRVNVMVNELSECDLVVGNGQICDSRLINTGMDLKSWRSSKTGFIKNIHKNSFIGCVMCFRRDILKYVLPVPSNVPMHDQWIGLLVTIFGAVKFIDVNCLYYRRHDNNQTTLVTENTNIRQIKQRVAILYLISVRVLKILRSRN